MKSFKKKLCMLLSFVMLLGTAATAACKNGEGESASSISLNSPTESESAQKESFSSEGDGSFEGDNSSEGEESSDGGFGDSSSEGDSSDGEFGDSSSDGGSGDSSSEENEVPQTGKSAIVKKTVFNGAEVDLRNAELREYLDADTEQAQARALLKYTNTILDKQALSFSWNGDGSSSYTVHFSKDKNFTDEITKTVSKTATQAGWLTPGATYYWKVTSAKGNSSSVDSFVTKDTPGAFTNPDEDMGHQLNMRDIGGWYTADGKRVKYNMLYRGGSINGNAEANALPLTTEAKRVFKDILGIKTELDFRGTDGGGQTECAFNADAKFVLAPFSAYTSVLPWVYYRDTFTNANVGYDSRVVDSFKTAFATLADESCYPLYFHCNAGADRTGTFAFLVNGLLGVSYEDLIRDYEITSFSRYGQRWRSDINDATLTFAKSGHNTYGDNQGQILMVYQNLMEYYEGCTLQQAIERYLIEEIGVTKTQINKLREIMLTE